MTIKKHIVIIIFLLLNTIIFSQQADKFILIDSTKNKGYEVDKGTFIKVQTDSIGYFGSLQNVTDEGVVVDNYHIKWNEIKSLTFEDKKIFDKWKKITLFSVIINFLLTTIAVIEDGNKSGFVFLVFFVITIPLLMLSLSFLIIGKILSKIGRTIKYKD